MLQKNSHKKQDTLSVNPIMIALGGIVMLGVMAALDVYFVQNVWGVIIACLLIAGMAGAAYFIAYRLYRAGLGGDVGEGFFLREAFHGVLTPQLITDEAGNVVLANRAFRGWLDVQDNNVEQALSARFSTTPKVAEDFKNLKTMLRKGQSEIMEMPVVQGDKVVEWRRIVTRPIQGIAGYFHWRFEDVSERHRMEKTMQDEQGQIVDFMANAPIGIYAVDEYGRFRFVNKTLAGWMQVEPDALVKGNVRLHDVMDNPPKGLPAYFVTDSEGGELHGEVMMRRRDGKTFPVMITQTIVRGDNGKTLRTRSVVRDLSPEKEWREALSVSENRFQRLFAEAPIGILLLDSAMRIVECNHAFLSMARKNRMAVVNHPLMDCIVPADREMVAAELDAVLKGGESKKPIDIHIAADRDVQAQVFIKRFAMQSEVVAANLMLSFIDATEQKKLEVQFSQSHKMQAIGQLAGGVAHDFNNLLTAMIGFCDLLLQRHKPGDQSFADIMQIKQNGNRAANLVRQLLAFSRQQTLQPKILSLVDVLSELTNLLRRLIGAQIELEMIHGRDVGMVKVDQGQLEQVIINLVVNARDAMPTGGKIAIRTRSHHQAQTIMRGQDEMPSGRYVVIEVVDTGCGIPQENLQRIFDPFFSTKEIGSGTGLGLSTVYGIVHQTGGFIHVDSEVNKGTCFSLYFPAYERETKPVAQAPVDEDKAESKGADLTGAGTILLVEDEDAVRVFSTRALRNKGYKVEEARSGEEALTILEREGKNIDLIVTDVVMPQMDGPTLYKHIREKWPSMKVIFVSGYTEDRLREQFKSGESIRFLSKPFTLKQLASKVKEVLDEEL